jgi:hypothetical protein
MFLPVAGYNSFAGFVYGVRIQLEEEIGLDNSTLQLVRSTEAMERIAPSCRRLESLYSEMRVRCLIPLTR